MIRRWSPELSALRVNQRAVDLLSDGQIGNGCQNCNGAEIMMVWMIESGPYKTPNGRKVKYLEFPAGSGLESGWFAGELHVGWCPMCSNKERK